MKAWATLVTALLVATTAAGAPGAELLLWDNYPGGVAGLQDPRINMSSQRNTQVVEATWVVDDVDIEQVMPQADLSDISVTRLEWVGARNPQFAYSKADVILLDTNRNPLFELSDLDYTLTDVSTDPDLGPDVQAYVGELTLETPISAADLGEHFYVGVRLVASGFHEGRNSAVTSSVDTTLRGRTQGYIKAAIFGAPYWRPASDVWYGEPDGTRPENFEFAFRLYADVVPEPASCGLLAVGGLLLLRRRNQAGV